MRFARGDVVVRSVPYAVVVDEAAFRGVCSACLRASSELFPCAKCRHLHYCSRQCQKSDWGAGHQMECSALARLPENFIPNTYTRLLARCLNRHKVEPDFSEQILGVSRTIADLVHHDEAKNDPELVNFFGECHRELRRHFEVPEASAERVEEMFLKLWVNSQSLGAESPLGLALYLGQSALDHSCVRDKRYAGFYVGTTFVIKALEDVDLSANDLRITYRPLLQPREHRLKELSRWYFSCRCPMCSGEVPELITNRTPEKLDVVSRRLAECADPNDAISLLKSHIKPELDQLRDFFQLQCAWFLAFRLLPGASRHPEAVPYLRAILQVVKDVYGEDEFYLRILRKVEDVCKPSKIASEMIEEERGKLQCLEAFFVL